MIVSTVVAERKIFVLAAHPFFLPKRLCPNDDAVERDGERPEFQQEWCSVQHWLPPDDPRWSADEREKRRPDTDRGGYFIRPPYAQLAHFLVVQKLLGRFSDIHCYMDGARDLSKAAMVAFRDRILAGHAAINGSSDDEAECPRNAEVVLYQHDKTMKKRGEVVPLLEKQGKALPQAWADAEKRFAEMENPPDQMPLATGASDPKVRADLYRIAFQGGHSKRAAGPGCTTLATRMPTATAARSGLRACPTRRSVARQGRPFGGHAAASRFHHELHARPRALPRAPAAPASGRSYRSNNVAPGVVLDELSAYLLRQNYDIRRSRADRSSPLRPGGCSTRRSRGLDVFDCAWNFRLGVTHAALISHGCVSEQAMHPRPGICRV